MEAAYMRCETRVLLCSLAIVCTQVAVAQDAATSTCSALLEHGLSNAVDYSNEYEFASYLHDEYCSTSWSNMSSSGQAAFGVAIKKIPLSFSGSKNTSKEQYEYFCSNFSQGQTGSSQTKYSAKTIANNAIDAWRDCIALAIGGTMVKPSITATQREVDFNLSATRGEAKFTGVDTAGMACALDGAPVSASESIPLTSNARSLRCTRAFEKLQFSGSTVEFFPAANVKVKTNTGDYRVDLYEMIDGPANDRLARLEAQIAVLQRGLDSGAKKLEALGQSRAGTDYAVNGPRIGGPDQYECPPGSYVSKIHASGSVGGKYAGDGISQITFRCAPLQGP
jgi:hypothetical protein